MAINIMKAANAVYNTSITIKNASATLNITYDIAESVVNSAISKINSNCNICNNPDLYKNSIDLVMEHFTTSINTATTSTITFINASANLVKLINTAVINNLSRIAATYSTNVYTAAGDTQRAALHANTASTLAASVAKEFASIADNAYSLSTMSATIVNTTAPMIATIQSKIKKNIRNSKSATIPESQLNLFIGINYVHKIIHDMATDITALAKLANDVAQFYADIVISSTAEANVIQASKLDDNQVIIVNTTGFISKDGNIIINAHDLSTAFTATTAAH